VNIDESSSNNELVPADRASASSSKASCRADLAAVAADLENMVAALREHGSDVLLFGLTDITKTGLIDPRYVPAMHERLVALADETRAIAARRGAIYVRMTEHPAASDPAIYGSDRLHANGRGHARYWPLRPSASLRST
jgi:hypothetical protein